MGLYIAVGTNSRIQKRCAIIQAGDVVSIPYPGGFVEIIKREWIDRPIQ